MTIQPRFAVASALFLSVLASGSIRPVAVESFFVAPQAMRAEHASLYELFKGFFEQDPAAEQSE